MLHMEQKSITELNAVTNSGAQELERRDTCYLITVQEAM